MLNIRTKSGFVRNVGVIALAVLALGACRAEEQGRVFEFEPGVYKGKADQKIPEEVLAAARARAAKQAGATSGGGGGHISTGVGIHGSHVRPPEPKKAKDPAHGG